MIDMEQAIRELAYQKWQDAGCPHGSADAFWLAAQRDIIVVSLSQMAKVSAASSSEQKKRKIKASLSSKKHRAA